MNNSLFRTVSDKTASPTRVRYVVLFGLCMAATIAYIHRNCISVAEETIRRDLGLSKEQMGQVMSAFYLTYAVFQIPSGWLSHVWGTRRALSLFTLAWSVLTGLLALAVTFPALYMVRLGMGAAQAGIFPSSTNTTARWFPRTRRALASGALAGFMSVGSAVCAILTGILLTYLEWQWLFALYALVGVLWTVWFGLWFRDEPHEHRSVNAAEVGLIRDGAPPAREPPAATAHEPMPWRALFASPAMWCICGQQFFRAAAYLFYASWFPTFLTETYNVSIQEAGWLTSLPFWAIVAGSFAGGGASDWLFERTGSRRLSRQGLAIFSMGFAALFVLLAMPLANVLAAVMLFSASSFSAALAAACGYVITIDMGGKHVAPVFSTMNMSGNVGAMILPAVIPYLVVKGTNDWSLVLLLQAGIYLAAGVCWALLNPNGTIVNQSPFPTPSSR